VDRGEISSLNVQLAPEAKQRLSIVTVLANSGNHHFRADNVVTVTDARGVEVGTVVAQSGSSVLPGSQRTYQVSIDDVPAGQLLVESRLQFPDGRIVAERQVTFVVREPGVGSSGARGTAPTVVVEPALPTPTPLLTPETIAPLQAGAEPTAPPLP